MDLDDFIKAQTDINSKLDARVTQLAIENIKVQRDLSLLHAHAEKVDGIIVKAYDWVTDTLKKYPWLSTVLPALASAAAIYFTGAGGTTKEVQVPGPERVITKETVREVPTEPKSIAKPK